MKLALSGPKPGTVGPSSNTAVHLDQENLLVEQGVFRGEGRAPWQMGQLCLTRERLRFSQPRGAVFDIPLKWIMEVAMEPKSFVVVRKPSMAVTFQDPRRRDPGKVWIITPMLGQWLKQLTPFAEGAKDAHCEPATKTNGATRPQSRPLEPEISAAALDRFAQTLEPLDQEMLWHLWFNRHAMIDELADLIGAPTHMDVLFRIRKQINPAAEKLMGRPILVFEESRLDPGTGEPVPFSWWLSGAPVAKAGPAPIEPEVFDDGDHFTIVLELVGVGEDRVRVAVQGDIMEVWTDDRTLNVYHEIKLPEPVDETSATCKLNNGIFSVQLQKSKGGV